MLGTDLPRHARIRSYAAGHNFHRDELRGRIYGSVMPSAGRKRRSRRLVPISHHRIVLSMSVARILVSLRHDAKAARSDSRIKGDYYLSRSAARPRDAMMVGTHARGDPFHSLTRFSAARGRASISPYRDVGRDFHFFSALASSRRYSPSPLYGATTPVR
jgi:hypothetical protein